MKIFPGIDTVNERKRFAVFHACTLMVSPIISAFVILIINDRWPFSSDKAIWLLGSILIWNFIGSLRFFFDANEEGFFVGRIMGVITLFGFPFVYLHNLWRVITKTKNAST